MRQKRGQEHYRKQYAQ